MVVSVDTPARFVLSKPSGVLPVHTAAGTQMHAGRFPENIGLFAASRTGKVPSGEVVHQSANVAHVQRLYRTAPPTCLVVCWTA
jgi:hypothetical protein